MKTIPIPNKTNEKINDSSQNSIKKTNNWGTQTLPNPRTTYVFRLVTMLLLPVIITCFWKNNVIYSWIVFAVLYLSNFSVMPLIILYWFISLGNKLIIDTKIVTFYSDLFVLSVILLTCCTYIFFIRKTILAFQTFMLQCTRPQKYEI